MTRTLHCLLGFLFVLLVTAPAVADAAGDEPLIEYQLGLGLVAAVGTDGVITVQVSDGAYVAPALTCTWPHEADPRRKDAPQVFMALAREGDPAGHRGFSRDADDDGDQRVNEDRLDGLDNDGDGLVDEDHAAVSHAMAVWNWRHGHRERHLETYHWAYPRLAGLVAAVFSARGTSPPPLRLDVPDAEWVKTDEFCFRDHAAGTGPTFVARIPAPGDPERWIWLGVALLDGQPRRLVTERVRATGPELSVPVLGSSQAIALAAGPTRLRVVRDLAAAVDIRDGVVDPVSGERMPWVPAALPPTPRAAALPSATLRPAPAGGFDLELVYADTPRLLFDPDLFRLDGEALTGASELRWSSRDGAASSLAWPAASGLADACHPYDQLDPAAPGSLVIHFSASGPVDGRDLEGVLEDGRKVTLPVTVLAPAIATASAPEPGPDPGDERLELSPGLLTNSPNPFRNSTRVSFRVPSTAGEAFAWEGEDEPPFDPRQRLPFAGGVAGVTVTVYDLEGRVIARLADGNFGQGEYQASWDGTDQLGRTVASGAYFCKLQIEKWSVTKRLVFIR